MENIHVDRRQEIHTLLKELGNRIQQERIQKGYELSEVTSALKIHAHILEAIEEGDLTSLPHLVYTKGFIRSYAQFLGIGEYELDPILRKLDDNEKTLEEIEENIQEDRKFSLYVWSVLILFLMLFLGGVWFFRNEFSLESLMKIQELTKRAEKHIEKFQEKDLISQSESIITPEVTIPSLIDESSNTPLVVEEESTNSTLILQVEKEKKKQPVDIIVSQETEHITVKNESVQQTVTVNNTSTLKENTNTESAHKNVVILKGLEECWVHSTADKTETRQFHIQQGQLVALPFNKTLLLKLGNAGGVEIKYNGEKIPSVGRTGQVKTMSFPLNTQP